MELLSFNATGDEMVEVTNTLVNVASKYDNCEQLAKVIGDIRCQCDILVDVNTKVLYDHNLNQLSGNLNKHIIYLKKIVECHLSSTDPALKEAAVTAKAVIDANRHVTTVGRLKKTGAVPALLKDLQDEKILSAASKLQGMTECIAAIEAAYDTLVTEMRSDTSQIIASKEVKPSAVKKELIKTVNEQFLVMLAALALMEGERYKEEYEEVCGIIADFNGKVNARYRAKRQAANKK
ncbi:MAG: DUF6261 family protein [Bacteroidia bacterium]|nr:DUF6261 family protein [Bacteroidia bacterium]